VAQVGESITNMDQATQQNAALVEEMASAASSLNSQAQELVQAVSVFQLGGGAQAGFSQAPALTPRPAAAPQLAPRKPAPLKARATPALNAPKAVAKPAAHTQGDDNWESF
jgi:methyl-accepting chemotaxis protein